MSGRHGEKRKSKKPQHTVTSSTAEHIQSGEQIAEAKPKGPANQTVQDKLGVQSANPDEEPNDKAGESIVWKWTKRIGILAGIGYAIVTFFMWRTMRDANKLAQKTFEVSQQASVTIGRTDGVVAELRNSGNPKLQDGLVIYFQNSGHMPAKFKWGLEQWFTENPVTMLPGTTPFEPMMRTRNKKTGAVTETASTDGSIGGNAVREVAVGYLPPTFVDYLFKTNKVFRVNGTYEYCDELGKSSCKTFSLAYQHSPFGTFRVTKNEDCLDSSWLGKTEAGVDEELLPMCVQRNAPPFPNR